MNCEHCGTALDEDEPQYGSNRPFEIEGSQEFHTVARCRERLKAMLADDDRILRASVPDRWKRATSPVGAAQSYIAELESQVEETQVVCRQRYYEDLEREKEETYERANRKNEAILAKVARLYKAFVQASAEKRETTAFGEVMVGIPMQHWSEIREAVEALDERPRCIKCQRRWEPVAGVNPKTEECGVCVGTVRWLCPRCDRGWHGQKDTVQTCTCGFDGRPMLARRKELHPGDWLMKPHRAGMARNVCPLCQRMSQADCDRAQQEYFDELKDKNGK